MSEVIGTRIPALIASFAAAAVLNVTNAQLWPFQVFRRVPSECGGL